MQSKCSFSLSISKQELVFSTPKCNLEWSSPCSGRPSSPRRAGGAGSELPRRKKGRCAHRPFKVNAVYLLLKQKLSYIQVCI